MMQQLHKGVKMFKKVEDEAQTRVRIKNRTKMDLIINSRVNLKKITRAVNEDESNMKRLQEEYLKNNKVTKDTRIKSDLFKPLTDKERNKVGAYGLAPLRHRENRENWKVETIDETKFDYTGTGA